MYDQILSSLSEAQMIQASLNGSRRMQDVLYNRFAAKMYQVCLRYTRNNTEDAKDIMQEGFIKVFSNLHKFRHDGSFEGWIRTIITRTALSRLTEKNRKLTAFDPALLHTVKDTSVSITDRLAEKDIIGMVKKLPAGYQKIFMLYSVEGYNHREIATMLKCNEGTSKSQLYRSKIRLQEMVRQTA